ncbi:MAG: LCP family protein [Oscillospiraceae bacterium]|nr:LCP family protein [Oscillospiraceae bacterium]
MTARAKKKVVRHGRLTPEERKKEARRKVLAFAGAAAAMGLTAILVFLAIAHAALDELGHSDGVETTNPYTTAGETTTEPEDPDFPVILDITDASGLRQFLKEWWHQGGEDYIRYSKDVVNVLLIGVDNSQDGDGGLRRSDTMMLASVNKKLGKVTLLSFLRDSYCYLNINGKESYERMNAAYAYGGAAAIMDNISHIYKIKVDKYISVDFDSFPKIVDALGGVTVDVSAAEARYLNKSSPSLKGQFPAGDGVTLTGRQALYYSRIRKLDSDNNRVLRQQKVIEAIINKARGSSYGQIAAAVKQTMPYVVTNFTNAEVLSLLPQAINWLSFKMDRKTFPIPYGEGRNALGSSIGGAMVWLVDYPYAAQQVQTLLYGESNIDVAADRQRNSYIDRLFRNASDSGIEYENYYSGVLEYLGQPTTVPEAGTAIESTQAPADADAAEEETTVDVLQSMLDEAFGTTG